MKQIRITTADLFILEGEVDRKDEKELVAHDEVLAGSEWIASLDRISQSSTAADHFMKVIRQIPVLSRQRERELITLAQAGDMASRDSFMWHNYRLVVHTARRFLGYLNGENPAIEFMDLVQQGNLGMMRAIEKFDLAIGTKFSTYATWWIRQSISRFIFDESKTIRLPVHIGEKLAKYKRAVRELEGRLGHTPDVFDIAEHIKCDVEEILVLRRVYQTARGLSLDYNFGNEGEDGPTPWTQRIPDNDHHHMEGRVDKAELARRLRVRMKIVCTNIRQYDILATRFGLDGKTIEEPTLQELGDEYGVTRERIRQLEADALKRLAADPELVLLAREYLGRDITLPQRGKLRHKPTQEKVVIEPQIVISKPREVKPVIEVPVKVRATSATPKKSPTDTLLVLTKFYGLGDQELNARVATPRLMRTRYLAVYLLHQRGVPLENITYLLGQKKSVAKLNFTYRRMCQLVSRDPKLRDDIKELESLLAA